MKLKYLVLLASIVCAQISFAARIHITGDIDNIQINGQNFDPYSPTGNAVLFIWMDELPIACGNSNGFKRMVITSDHPAYQSVLSIALTAQATQKPVTVSYIDECTQWSSAWDFATLKID